MNFKSYSQLAARVRMNILARNFWRASAFKLAKSNLPWESRDKPLWGVICWSTLVTNLLFFVWRGPGNLGNQREDVQSKDFVWWILENGHLQPGRSFAETLCKVLNLSKSGRLGSRLVRWENIRKTELMAKGSRKRIIRFRPKWARFFLFVNFNIETGVDGKYSMLLFQISPFLQFIPL